MLRRAGVNGRILVFGALSVSDLDGLFEYDLTPTCSTPGAGRALQAAAAGARPTPSLPPEDRHRAEPPRVPPRQPRPDAAGAVRQPEPRPRRRLHALRDGRRSGAPAVRGAAARFDGALAGSRGWAFPCRRATRPTARPCCATRACGSTRSARGSCSTAWRRPVPAVLPLRPVLTLRSRIVSVKHVRPGEGVGYGARFSPETPRVVATIPAGYADGLDTRLAGRGHVLVGGRRAPIVGAVSMDMLAVDVTDCPSARATRWCSSATRGTSGSRSARWRRRSARFPTKSSAASARASSGFMMRAARRAETPDAARPQPDCQ